MATTKGDLYGADLYGTMASIERRKAAYAGPAQKVPRPTTEDWLRAALAKERAELQEAKRTIERLEGEASELRVALIDFQNGGTPDQTTRTSQSRQAVTARMVKDDFLLALAAERYIVDGESLTDVHFTRNYRPSRYTKPRQVGMWLCRKITGAPYPAVGRLFGDRHHTTVMHAEEQVESGAAFTSPMLLQAANRVLLQYGLAAIVLPEG